MVTDLGKRGPAAGDHRPARHPTRRRQVPAHRHQLQRGPAVLPQGRRPGRERHGPRHLDVQGRRPGHHVRPHRPRRRLPRRRRRRTRPSSAPPTSTPPPPKPSPPEPAPPGSPPACSPATPPGSTPTPTTSTTSILDHLATVWPPGEEKVWWDDLAERLAATYPGLYGTWTGEQVTAAVKPHGLKSIQIKRTVDGKQLNRRGLARTALQHALDDRPDTTDDPAEWSVYTPPHVDDTTPHSPATPTPDPGYQ